MLLEDIRDEVQLIVQGSTFTDEMVDGFINDVYISAVGKCLVPEMKTVDVVDTVLGQAYTSLSGLTGGFSGVLSRVYNSDSKSIEIYPTLEALIDSNGSLEDEGSVEVVALEGATLWYYPTPADEVESLTVVYFRNAEDLIADGDSPDVLPEFLHRKILVNGAAAICFDMIEGGVEGLKVNTRSREMAMQEGIVRFREWLGKTRKHYVYAQEPA